MYISVFCITFFVIYFMCVMMAMPMYFLCVYDPVHVYLRVLAMFNRQATYNSDLTCDFLFDLFHYGYQ